MDQNTIAQQLKEDIINRKALLLAELPAHYRDTVACLRDTRILWNAFHEKLLAISALVKEFESLYDVPIEPPKEGGEDDDEEEAEKPAEEEKPTPWQQKIQRFKDWFGRTTEPIVFWWLRGYDSYKTFYKAWKRPHENEKSLPFKSRYLIYRQQHQLKRYHKQGIDPLVSTAEHYAETYEELIQHAQQLFSGELVDFELNPSEKNSPLEILDTAKLCRKYPATLWIQTVRGSEPQSVLQALNKTFKEAESFFSTTLRVTRDTHVNAFLFDYRMLHRKTKHNVAAVTKAIGLYEKDVRNFCGEALDKVRKW